MAPPDKKVSMQVEDVENKNNSSSSETKKSALRDLGRIFPQFKRQQDAKRRESVQHLSRHMRSREDPLILNEEDIFQTTQNHNNFVVRGTTLSGLDKFDDTAAYGVSQADEERLIRIEIKRLVSTAVSPGPYMFSSNSLWKAADDASWEEVSNIVDQILANLHIITQDNVLVSMDHCADIMYELALEFKNSRRRLLARFNEEDYVVKGQQPKLLSPPERNKEIYFAMVNYVTGCIGKLLIRTSSSKYWANQLFSILAQWSVKLKILSDNPVEFAKMSLDQGEEYMVEKVAGFHTQQTLFLKVRLDAESSDHKNVDTLDTETHVASRYYWEKTLFRRKLERMVHNSLVALMDAHGSTDSLSCFEASTIVYRTGLDELQTVLSSARDGDVAGTSDSVNVNGSFTALQLLHTNILCLPKRVKQPTCNSANEEAEDSEQQTEDCLIMWEWAVGQDGLEEDNRYTNQLDELLSVLIPLALSTPWTTSIMDSLISLASSGTTEDDPITQFPPPSLGFQAMFSVQTNAWLMKQRSLRYDKQRDRDVQAVSASPMRRAIRIGTSTLSISRLSKSRRDTGMRKEFENRAAELREIYANAKAKMDTWTIAEQHVTIKCRRYVIIVMVLAALLVCGGMVIPFTVDNRIRGVDPFQITTFSWIIAGFFIVLCKSRYVNVWPWHDFLRGQVVCHSVSEVCDVTGFEVQMVLSYLLHDEYSNNLVTKGPFNGMFRRKAKDADGFAIDQPVALSTMLGSGFIILKVLNESGEHLVCMDVRKGMDVQAPEKMETAKYLACPNIGKEDLQTTSHVGPETEDEYNDSKSAEKTRNRLISSSKVKKLNVWEFRWNRVLGLYTRDSYFG